MAPAGSPSTPLALMARTPWRRSRGQDLDGSAIAGLGPREVHPLGGDGQHEGGLGAAGVEVAGPARRPGGHRLPLGLESGRWPGPPGSALPPWVETTTTWAKSMAGRPAQFDQHHLGGLLSDRQGPGKVLVLAARSVGESWGHHQPTVAGGGAVGHCQGDVGVGGQRQMGTVLLGRAHRDEEDRTRPGSARTPRGQVMPSSRFTVLGPTAPTRPVESGGRSR